MTTQQTVRVYSKPACVQCRMTEKWLTEHKVPYIHDSAEYEGVIAAARELGISAAPIVVVQTLDQSSQSAGHKVLTVSSESPGGRPPQPRCRRWRLI